ncbi:MAG: hypothetical protein M1445_15870, partial [Bacteroidetes bacterium]|nr:hypothetical protein [Bacteroidota bacterium]
MNKSFKIEVIEILLFGVIWIGIFSIPFFNQWGYRQLDWEKLYIDWLHIFGFFLIFLVNIAVLIPKYLIQQKYRSYIISAFVLISGIIASGFFLNELLFPTPLAMPPMNLGSGIPMELGSNMPAPIGFKPERKTGYDSLSLQIIADFV